MSKLAIFCAGNLGKEICDMAERINYFNSQWSELFFVDNYSEKRNFYEKKVYRLEECSDIENTEFIIANGEPSVRCAIYNQLKEKGCHLINLIDPTVIISPTARLGEGIIITPYTTLSSDVVIGDNALIQSYIRVGHDIHIGNHCVISANTAIGGKTTLDDEVFVGMGAVIKEELHLGRQSILGMGAVLYKDLEMEATAVGNPARVTRGSDDKKVFH